MAAVDPRSSAAAYHYARSKESTVADLKVVYKGSLHHHQSDQAFVFVKQSPLPISNLAGWCYENRFRLAWPGGTMEVFVQLIHPQSLVRVQWAEFFESAR